MGFFSKLVSTAAVAATAAAATATGIFLYDYWNGQPKDPKRDDNIEKKEPLEAEIIVTDDNEPAILSTPIKIYEEKIEKEEPLDDDIIATEDEEPAIPPTPIKTTNDDKVEPDIVHEKKKDEIRPNIAALQKELHSVRNQQIIEQLLNREALQVATLEHQKIMVELTACNLKSAITKFKQNQAEADRKLRELSETLRLMTEDRDKAKEDLQNALQELSQLKITVGKLEVKFAAAILKGYSN